MSNMTYMKMYDDSLPYYVPGGLTNLFTTTCWLYALAYAVIAGVKFYRKARKDDVAAFACAAVYMGVVPFISVATGSVAWVLFTMMSAGAATPWVWLVVIKKRKQGIIGIVLGVIIPMSAVAFIANALLHS